MERQLITLLRVMRGWTDEGARSNMERYALYIQLAGLALVLVGWIWMLVRAFRHRVVWGVAILLLPPLAMLFGLWHWRKGLLPLGVMALGLIAFSIPPAYNKLVDLDLGPRDTMVGGERHITLTGWDHRDYATLGSKRDVVVLQMANPDVTDETLEYLSGMKALRELDLSNTRVTDRGLKILRDLPALSVLRLKNTKITDQGFRESLAGKESLKMLDVSGTRVDRESVQAWRKAREGRRALL
jgi:hypothetical protein